ncbi:MAG: phytanoyl-CoA dioxygenase family protein, partial [Pseudomonadota bacterium]
AESLIGEPVYHFQSKLTAKDPLVGGAWEWHQDYGYWYYNGCLEPKMLSFMIALDHTVNQLPLLAVVLLYVVIYLSRSAGIPVNSSSTKTKSK